MAIWTVLKDLVMGCLGVASFCVALYALDVWRRTLRGNAELPVAKSLWAALGKLHIALLSAQKVQIFLFAPFDDKKVAEAREEATMNVFGQMRNAQGLVEDGLQDAELLWPGLFAGEYDDLKSEMERIRNHLERYLRSNNFPPSNDPVFFEMAPEFKTAKELENAIVKMKVRVRDQIEVYLKGGLFEYR